MSDRKPIANFRTKSGCQIAMWPQDGGRVTFGLITKRYHDKEAKEWKESKSLFLGDLAELSVILPEAYRAGLEYEAQNKSTKGEVVTQSAPVVSRATDDDDIPF